MKKVLHIVEALGGGVFSFLVDLINGTEDEFEIIIAYGKRTETLNNFKDYFGNKVKFIEIKNFTRKINLIKDLKALKEIKKVIKENKPDIIHLHSSKAGILGRLAISGKKVKMFYNPHAFSFFTKNNSKIKNLIYWMIEKITAIWNKNCKIIGCSQGEYKEAKRLNKNSICINNGINIEKLGREIPQVKENKINFKNLKICTVGRIEEQKNPNLFNEIAKRFPDNHFTWIGDGELKNKLTSSNIEITGWQTREEVLKILNEQDIFILGSLWEGLPISLLEAMYLKKICIVSNCIGNRDVINERKNGFVADNIEEYINIINNIRNSKVDVTKIVEKAHEDVENKYNTKLMINLYKEKYRRKKVVLHIVNSNIFSGLEKVAVNIIKSLEEYYDFYYVTREGPIIKYLEQNKVKYIKIKKVCIKEIKRICKEYETDILHVHDYTATIISSLINVKIPIISHLHNNSPWLKRLHPYSFALLLANLRCNKFLTVSDSIKNEYIFSKIISKKIENIGNPVSVEEICNKVEQNLEKKYDVCFSGRLTEQKNPIKFINIIANIKKDINNIKVIMLGDGKLRESCEKEIKRLNLQDNIILLGFVDNPYTYMSQSKIFCLTSDWEGYGLVAFEALALGIPCVVSDVGGLPMIVDDSCGKVVNTEEQFKESILQILLGNEYNNLCQNALKKANKLDNKEKYMLKIQEIYESEK